MSGLTPALAGQVIAAVQRAGQLLADPAAVQRIAAKSATDFVTNVDCAVQNALREQLAQLAPEELRAQSTVISCQELETLLNGLPWLAGAALLVLATLLLAILFCVALGRGKRWPWYLGCGVGCLSSRARSVSSSVAHSPPRRNENRRKTYLRGAALDPARALPWTRRGSTPNPARAPPWTRRGPAPDPARFL